MDPADPVVTGQPLRGPGMAALSHKGLPESAQRAVLVVALGSEWRCVLSIRPARMRLVSRS